MLKQLRSGDHWQSGVSTALFGGFGYYFPDTPDQCDDWQALAALDALAESLAGAGGALALPEAHHRFGQLVFQDMFAHRADCAIERRLSDPELCPHDRLDITRELMNQRAGRLDFASVLPVNTPDFGGKRLKWLAQWLLLEDFLPMVCDPEVMGWVQANGAPLYDRFAGAAASLCAPGTLPVALEFTALPMAFAGPVRPYAFDGNPPALRDALVQAEIARVNPGERPDPVARLRRGLRYDFRVNLPSAQACLSGLEQRFGLRLARLDTRDLVQGAQGEALEFGNLTHATPLSFYILRESQVMQGGCRLGPLGSHLLAQSLWGALHGDADSYLNHPDADWAAFAAASPGANAIADLFEDPALI